jgi:hypothetical protein
MHKSIYIHLLLAFVALLSFTSCEDDGFLERDRKPEHSGEIGELLVVIDKPYWDGILVKTIKDSLEMLNFSLPQPEPFFNIRLVSPQHFNTTSNTHHTILYIDILKKTPDLEPRLDEPQLNVWAKDQFMFKLWARSEVEAVEVFKIYAQKLRTDLDGRTKELALKKVAVSLSKEIDEELGITLGLTAKIPTGFNVAGNFSEMIWLNQLRMRYADGKDHEIQIGIMAYTYPYLDSTTFTQEWLLDKRDSITKKYIKGSLLNSYMTTERSEGLASKELLHNGIYTYELRGLWRMENALMGGPFMSITMFDEKRNRIVTLDGYVFAPYFRKMEYMREVEAMLYSFKFID